MENTVCPPYRLNFNPRSPHGERRAVKSLSGATNEISTHAPRTGSDTRTERQGAEAMHFNPRSPHGERRGRGCFSDGKVCRFQPTLPARGATVAPLQRVAHVLISTHAPRTGSDDQGADTYESFAISTHAPRTGSDVLLCCVCRSPRHFNPRSPHGERLRSVNFGRSDGKDFNPRSPHGERRIAAGKCPFLLNFNPRSPHGERRSARPGRPTTAHFNPRSPHGERPGMEVSMPCLSRFQPTLPARGATDYRVSKSGALVIFQPTLPARGATLSWRDNRRSGWHFNPRSPHGERQLRHVLHAGRRNFNPRSPHGERRRNAAKAAAGTHFNPRSPHGERLFWRTLPDYVLHFNPRSPHGERPAIGQPIHPILLFQPTLPARGATIMCRS